MVRAQDTPSPSPDAQTTVQSRSSPRMSPTPADSSSVTSLFPLIKFSLSCQIPPLDLTTTEGRMPRKNRMFKYLIQIKFKFAMFHDVQVQNVKSMTRQDTHSQGQMCSSSKDGPINPQELIQDPGKKGEELRWLGI